MWGDDNFRQLTPGDQHLLFVVTASPSISHCGVADWRPGRIAALAAGWTAAAVRDTAADLIERLYLVVDESTEEVLVRSFIRDEELMRQPKMAVAVARAHDSVASAVLRGVIVHELRWIKEESPELACWASTKVAETLAKASVDPSTYPLGKGRDSHHDTLPIPLARDKLREGDRGADRGTDTLDTPPHTPPQRGAQQLAPSTYTPNSGTDSLRSSGAAAPPTITAGTITAAWVEAYEAHTDTKASGGLRGQVGREAKRLLDDGADPELVLQAARDVAEKGRATLEREYGPLAAGGHTRSASEYADFQLPTPPREIRDDPDPEVYHRWAREQRAQWDAARRPR